MRNATFGTVFLWMVLAVLSGAGCGVSQVDQAGLEQERQELARLREENEQIPRLKAEIEQLHRLKRDNLELLKLRGQLQAMEEVRKENDRLRGQLGLAARRNDAASEEATRAREAALAAAMAREAEAVAVTGQGGAEEAINPEDAPQEGDEIYIEPKLIGLIVPGDWESLQRTEPVGVKGLLESHGIVLTNYQQLKGYGITNYQIHRASKTDAGAGKDNPK